MEVFNQFETRALKHLGSMLTDNADQWRETNRVVQAGFYAVKRLAKIWSLGTPRGRGSSGGLTSVRKLKVMRAVLEGTLLACGKTRVWNQAHERKANQVLARGIRRCLGLDVFNMSENNYSDASLRNMVCWDSFPRLFIVRFLNGSDMWPGCKPAVPLRWPCLAGHQVWNRIDRHATLFHSGLHGCYRNMEFRKWIGSDWLRSPPETGYKYWIRPYLDPNRPDSINPP